MEIKDKLDELMAFVDNGAKGNLSDDMIEYISILELIRGMHLQYKNREAIIKFLQKPPYELSPYLATKYYSDAVNFFYLNVKIKKQAWRNMYADELDRAANLCLQTAKTAKDLDIYKNIKLAASNMRQLDLPEKEDIPPEFFQKKIRIYTLDPKQIGRQRPDRNKLARHLDSLDIPETEKQRIKQDAMIEDVEFLTDYED